MYKQRFTGTPEYNPVCIIPNINTSSPTSMLMRDIHEDPLLNDTKSYSTRSFLVFSLQESSYFVSRDPFPRGSLPAKRSKVLVLKHP